MKKYLTLALMLLCLGSCADGSPAALPLETTGAPSVEVTVAAPAAIAPPETTACPETTAAPESTVKVWQTEPIAAPVPLKLTVDYAPTQGGAVDADISGGDQPAVDVMITTDQPLPYIGLVAIDVTADPPTYGEVLYTGSMTPEKPFVVRMVFYGDLSNIGFFYSDPCANPPGTVSRSAITMSGKDGSLLLFDPWAYRFSLTAKDITPTGLTLVAESGKLLIYGRAFGLEVLKQDVWTPVPSLHDNVAWEAIGIELPANRTQEIKVDWSNIYGSLPAGQYRIIKAFGGDTYTVDFTIP